MIGETVPLNSYFSNGENWTNILPKCKCGIKLAFKTNIEKGGPANIKIY
jgi:hypothetical protein